MVDLLEVCYYLAGSYLFSCYFHIISLTVILMIAGRSLVSPASFSLSLFWSSSSSTSPFLSMSSRWSEQRFEQKIQVFQCFRNLFCLVSQLNFRTLLVKWIFASTWWLLNRLELCIYVLVDGCYIGEGCILPIKVSKLPQRVQSRKF